MLMGVVCNQAIDFVCRDTWRNIQTQIVHELGVEFSRKPHPVSLDFRQLKLAYILQHAYLEIIASIKMEKYTEQALCSKFHKSTV